ncbi:MAG: leucine-rich repeat domain-containing protein [Bacteroidales bacterium]|nr:leucine-rich repeat domain-containing protein [Bacteroidales bacterium]
MKKLLLILSLIVYSCNLFAQNCDEILNYLIKKCSANNIKVSQLSNFISDNGASEMFVTLNDVTDKNFDDISDVLRHSYCNLINIVIQENPKFTRIPDNWIFENDILKNFNLRSLVIPSTVKYIGENAFYKCLNLENLLLSDNKNKKLILGKLAFNQCESLKNINFLDRLEIIPNSVFLGCESLELTEIPNNIKNIETRAFAFCTSLKNIKLPKYLQKIDTAVFYWCSSLKNVEISNFTKEIEPQAFSMCDSLENINVLKNTNIIKSRVFYSCGFDSIEIPNNITKIESLAFSGTDAYTIKIPNSVIEIESNAFSSLKNLYQVIIEGKPKIGDGNFTFSDSLLSRYLVIYVQNDLVDDFKHNMPKFNIKPISEIGKSDDYKRIEILKNTLNNSDNKEITLSIDYANDENLILIVRTIKNSTAIVNLDLSKSIKLTSIYDNDFFSLTNLKSIILPNSLVSIGKSAFRGCDSLQNIVIPNSVTDIGTFALNSCNSLTEIVLPKNLKTIRDYMLSGCYNLKKITLPDGLITIADDAFRLDTSLVEINIPKSVEKIGNGAFACCYSLENINIPSKVKHLEENLFWGCHSLKNINISEGVEVIHGYFIFACINLECITFPKSVIEIKSDAIFVLDNFKYITIEGNPSLKDDSFNKGFSGPAKNPIRVHKQYLDDYKKQFPEYNFETIEQ